MEEYLAKGIKIARVALFLVAGAALTYYLLSRPGSVEETAANIFNILGNCSIPWLSSAFALFIISQVIRSWRWKLLSDTYKVSMKKTLPVTSVYIGLSHILPVRLADIALVGLFRKYASLPAGSGAATVMLAKVMDVIAIGSVVALSFVTGMSGPVIYLSLGIALLGISSLFFLSRILALFSIPLKALLGQGRVTAAWGDMIESVRITKERRGTLSLAMGASIAGWTVKLLMFHMLLRAVGVTGLPIWQVFTAGAITDLIMALPIHGLLNLGTVEVGWVAGFALTGITGTLPGDLSVVEAGFSIHLLWLSMAVLLMLAGTSVLLISGGKDPS